MTEIHYKTMVPEDQSLGKCLVNGVKIEDR